jgi:hypothetical protein
MPGLQFSKVNRPMSSPRTPRSSTQWPILLQVAAACRILFTKRDYFTKENDLRTLHTHHPRSSSGNNHIPESNYRQRQKKKMTVCELLFQVGRQLSQRKINPVSTTTYSLEILGTPKSGSERKSGLLTSGNASWPVTKNVSNPKTCVFKTSMIDFGSGSGMKSGTLPGGWSSGCFAAPSSFVAPSSDLVAVSCSCRSKV